MKSQKVCSRSQLEGLRNSGISQYQVTLTLYHYILVSQSAPSIDKIELWQFSTRANKGSQLIYPNRMVEENKLRMTSYHGEIEKVGSIIVR
jgi:hypothetical protein